MKIYGVFILLFFTSIAFSQKKCKEIVIEVCIDGESKLHIKKGVMWWEHLSNDAPGTHFACKVATTVNGKTWTNWKDKYKTGINTHSMTVNAKVLKANETSKIIQQPGAANNWETIWYFNDPSASSHVYQVSFSFCQPKAKQEAEKKEEKKMISFVKKEPEKNYELSFYPGKTDLTDISEAELAFILSAIYTKNQDVTITGYPEGESTENIKLYEARAQKICNYLIEKGVPSSRISYLGYGSKKKDGMEIKIIK